MAYKEGTYRLNLGLNVSDKNKLDILQAEHGFENYTKLVRYLINQAYEASSKESSIDYNLASLHADISEIREILQKCLEVKNGSDC